MGTPDVLLALDSVDSGYGLAQVLRSVTMTVRSGEVVGLLGRNGMGKTTTLRTIMGLNPAWAGQITFAGQSIERATPDTIARSGLALVPETRRIFGSLSVAENLRVAYRPRRGGTGPRWSYDDVVELFPRLGERRRNMGNQLSGGEQQMLAIGRGLMANPALLLIDEAFEGLAPLLRREIGGVLTQLAAAGQAILLVDSESDRVGELADRVLILELGKVVWEGSGDTFRTSAPALSQQFLGV